MVRTANDVFAAELKKIRQNRSKEYTLHQDLSAGQVSELIDAVGSNRSLTKLDLSYREIGDKAIHLLALAVNHHPSLEIFSLTQNQITAQSAGALASMLRQNRHLRHLNLADNNLGDDGLKTLLTGLKENRTLQKLYLSKTGIGDGAMQDLSEILHHSRMLGTLDLHNNSITDQGAKDLAQGLRYNRNLTRLDVMTNPISPAGNAALEKALLSADHKNLTHYESIHATQAMRDLCKRNLDITRELESRLKDFTPENRGTPQQWWNFIERLPAIRDMVGTSQKRTDAIARFTNFLDTLPTLNPHQPISMDMLTRKVGGYTPLDNPLTWLKFGQVVKGLNAGGHYLNAETLLEADRKTPKPMFEQIIAHNVINTLFTQDNWSNASKSDFQAVVRALPEAAQKSIPNHQQLLVALERNSRVNER